jgi:hypothetical protein
MFPRSFVRCDWESLNGFPLLDLMGSFHTALLFIRSENRPEPIMVPGWRTITQNSNSNNFSDILREGCSVSLYGESVRLQTMPSRSIFTICSNSNRPEARRSSGYALDNQACAELIYYTSSPTARINSSALLFSTTPGCRR